MANEQHLKILKKGVEAWNAWRREHPGVRPDLSGATLTQADLSKALPEGAFKDRLRSEHPGIFSSDTDIPTEMNLVGVDFSGANLSELHCHEGNFSGADLSGADLTGAHLMNSAFAGAKLTKALLIKAHLKYVRFSGADLYGADLSEAVLYGADLRRANLRLAKLHEAALTEADFRRADLSFASLTGVYRRNTNFGGAKLEGTCLERENGGRKRALLIGALLLLAAVVYCAIRVWFR